MGTGEALQFAPIQSAIADGVTAYVGGTTLVYALAVSYYAPNCPYAPPPAMSVTLTAASLSATSSAAVLAALQAASEQGSAGAGALAAALRAAGVGASLAGVFTYFPIGSSPPPVPGAPDSPPPPPVANAISNLVLLSLLGLLIPLCGFLGIRVAAWRNRRRDVARRVADVEAQKRALARIPYGKEAGAAMTAVHADATKPYGGHHNMAEFAVDMIYANAHALEDAAADAAAYEEDEEDAMGGFADGYSDGGAVAESRRARKQRRARREQRRGGGGGGGRGGLLAAAPQPPKPAKLRRAPAHTHARTHARTARGADAACVARRHTHTARRCYSRRSPSWTQTSPPCRGSSCPRGWWRTRARRCAG
jgi:hypothetical protein